MVSNHSVLDLHSDYAVPFMTTKKLYPFIDPSELWTQQLASKLYSIRSAHRLSDEHRQPRLAPSKSIQTLSGRAHSCISPPPPLTIAMSRSNSVASSEVSPSTLNSSSRSSNGSLKRNGSTESSKSTTANMQQRPATASTSTTAPRPPTPPPKCPRRKRRQERRQPSVATLLSLLPAKSSKQQPNAPSIAASCDDSGGFNGSESTLLLSKASSLRALLANNKRQRRQEASMRWGYLLSSDDMEQDRLVAQHYLLRMAFHGHDFHAFGVRPLLEQGGDDVVVLDVGCGPGAWTMEMASQFPKATFIGIDQTPCYPQHIKPKNCHFRHYIIQDGTLPFPDNSVDYIFQRDLNWGLTTDTWKVLISEYMRILKPGGWVELVEQDLETQSSLDNECALNDKILQGMVLRNQDPHMARHLSTLLAVNGFRRIESQFQSLPLGWDPRSSTDSDKKPNSTINITNNSDPFEDLQRTIVRKGFCSELARVTASQQLFLLQSLQPWLSLVTGLNPKRYTQYALTLPESWRLGQSYINWHCATAQKPPKKI